MYSEDIKEDNFWLMKGDCLERMKEIPSGSVDLILTDPPYSKADQHKLFDTSYHFIFYLISY